MTGQWRPGGKSNHEIGGDTVSSVLRGALGVREACKAAGLAPEQHGAWARAFRRTALRAFDDGLRLALGRRAWEGDGLGVTEFQGPVAELSVMDLIQAMALGRRDGVIAVAHDGSESRLWCAAGEIVDAESGALVGEPAVYRVLALERGHVNAELCTVQRERSIRRPTPALLLEAARRKDELERLRARFAGVRFVSARTAAGELDPARATLLTALQSPRGVAELLATSGLGEFETLATLALLLEAREVTPVGQDAEAASALSMRPLLEGPASTLRGVSSHRFTAALAVGAIAAAGAVALVAGGGAPAPAQPATSERAPDESIVMRRGTPGQVAPDAPVAPASSQTAASPHVPVLAQATRAVLPAAARSLASTAPSAAAQQTPPAPAPPLPSPPLPAPPSAASRPRRDVAPPRTPSPELRAPRSQPSASERPTEPLVPRMRIIEEHVPHMQIVE